MASSCCPPGPRGDLVSAGGALQRSNAQVRHSFSRLCKEAPSGSADPGSTCGNGAVPRPKRPLEGASLVNVAALSAFDDRIEETAVLTLPLACPRCGWRSAT